MGQAHLVHWADVHIARVLVLQQGDVEAAAEHLRPCDAPCHVPRAQHTAAAGPATLASRCKGAPPCPPGFRRCAAAKLTQITINPIQN